MEKHDKVFAGSIPKLYESHLVPLIFAPYARDLAERLARKSPALSKSQVPVASLRSMNVDLMR